MAISWALLAWWNSRCLSPGIELTDQAPTPRYEEQVTGDEQMEPWWPTSRPPKEYRTITTIIASPSYSSQHRDRSAMGEEPQEEGYPRSLPLLAGA